MIATVCYCSLAGSAPSSYRVTRMPNTTSMLLLLALKLFVCIAGSDFNLFNRRVTDSTSIFKSRVCNLQVVGSPPRARLWTCEPGNANTTVFQYGHWHTPGPIALGAGSSNEQPPPSPPSYDEAPSAYTTSARRKSAENMRPWDDDGLTTAAVAHLR